MKNDKLNTNFKIPDNYFNHLEKEVYLKTLKEQETFKTPSDYFKNLEETIIQKTINSENQKSKRYYIHSSWWVAASFILVVSVVLSIVLVNQKPKTEMVSRDVEHEVYQKIYDSYIVNEDNKKSSNVALDDSDFVLYNY